MAALKYSKIQSEFHRAIWQNEPNFFKQNQQPRCETRKGVAHEIVAIAIRRSESHVRLQAAALFPQARYEKRAVRMGTQLHEEFARDYPVEGASNTESACRAKKAAPMPLIDREDRSSGKTHGREQIPPQPLLLRDDPWTWRRPDRPRAGLAFPPARAQRLAQPRRRSRTH